MERILIIDDDITFALMLKTWLSKKGFQTETAASVAAARTALAEGGFSLVLSDMRLPDEDGIALLQWMSGQHMEIPVIQAGQSRRTAEKDPRSARRPGCRQ